MNPANYDAKLLDDEQEVADQDAGIDYDEIYGGLDIQTEYERPKELQKKFSDMFGSWDEETSDYAKQFAKETLIGFGGTYGDLAELVGIPTGPTEATNQKNSREFDALKRMEEPGYQPSLSDIETISSGDSVEPSLTGLPTSQNFRDLGEQLGAPGDPETIGGKAGARTGKLYGSGVAFGQVNPIPAVLAGGAGQAVEEGGGGPLLQAAAEIVTLLATQGRGQVAGAGKKAAQQKIEELRKLGYADEEITLAINAAHKSQKAAKASKGASTEKAFDNFANKSEQLVSDILVAEIPGIEKGTQYVHEMASQAYGQVAKDASKIIISDSRPFLDASKRVVDKLRNTLGKNPEAEAFIKRISEAAIDSTQYPSAEKMINFYKELNGMGKWLGRSQKDALISEVKQGIKETFKKQGKEGKELAEKFEKVNAGIKKAYDAEDLHNLLLKAATDEGINFTKMSKLFDKAENVELMETVLGQQQTSNLRNIAKTGKEVKDFDKTWTKLASALSASKYDVVRGGAAAYFLSQGDYEGLIKVAATKLGTAGARAISRKLNEQMLTNPKLQNMTIKLLHSLKTNSPQGFKTAVDGINKYLKDEGLDIDPEDEGLDINLEK